MKRRGLPVLEDNVRDAAAATALSAQWPEPVLALSEEERGVRVRMGQETVLLSEGEGSARKTRGFVRAVLKVPLGHPRASTYGVFVEVDRAAYQVLQKAFSRKERATVWGRLATRLPHLEEALGAEVELLEDGSELRARIVSSRSELLRDGPPVGARRP